MKTHEHQWVLLGPLDEREGYGSRPVYWCRDCGMVLGKYATMVATMTPTWSEQQLKNVAERHTYIKQPTEKLHRSRSRLGRGLVDLMKERGMRVLPGMPTEEKS
jgi:hypothetical protein